MQNDRKEITDLTIAIVDDDPNAIKALADVLNRNFGITVAASATSAQSAIEITGKSKPDILFLDIQLNDESAIDSLAALKEASPDTKIVFYTAYQKYMISAIRTHAFDFLLKPVDNEELSIILHRYLASVKTATAIQSRSAVAAPIPEKKALSIITVTNDRLIVNVCDIVYFKYHSERKLWEVVLNDFRHHILRRQTTSESILSRFPEFVRTHKSFIVNVSYISMISSDRCVLLPPFDNSSDIKISKIYRKDLLDRFYDI